MNPLYDLEIIESAVMSGEIDDAMNLIKRRKNFIQTEINISGSEKLRSHLKVLSSIESYLMDSEDFEKLKIVMYTNYVYGEEDKEGFLENFLYHLYYSKDRYNVRYPYYDGKRCDDL